MRTAHLTLVVLALVGLSATSPGQLALNLEFNQDGVLPSSDINVNLHNNSGLPESSVYSVSGGLLEQRSFNINGNVSYNIFEQGTTNPDVSVSLGTVLEARLKVLAIQGSGGAYFQAGDGTNRYSALFTPVGVEVLTPTGNVSVPVDVSQFHTYRIESPPNSDAVTLFVDGVQMFSGTAASTSSKFIGWGDGVTPAGNGADVDWEYVRFSNGTATYSPFGQGCAGTAGTLELSSVAGQLPWIGESFQLQATNVLPGNLTFLIVGFSNTLSGGLTLPFDLAAIGMPGCTQYVSLEFPLGAVADQTGTAGWSLPLPDDFSLVGLEFYLQGVAFDAAANLTGVVASNAAEAMIWIR